ncbi:hypothetical protein TNCV_4934881 [Trichonephila clavipes]|uniref:Uncharacterized protein n=1 Tax=Trichonephila clavipes TaxID=2585209 RepID=A0A8X6VGU3_TRICX|nr:hypothetical protein TNCV_4934881 [Trichonephila clavipes]
MTIGEAYLKIIMSSFLGFCEWNTRNRWRDGQVCPDVDKELWPLGHTPCYAPIRRKEERPGKEKKEVTRKERLRKRKREREKEEKRARKRQGLVFRKRRGESQSFLLGDADQESETRMSKNALRTGRRQAVE